MCNQTVSCWQKASTIATYLQVVAVTISLLLIRSQLEQQKSQLGQQTQQLNQQLKLSQAANTQSLVNLATPLNLKVTDREMAELWVMGEDGIAHLSPTTREVQKQRYEQLLASYLTFYENVYSQNQAGLLEPEIYKGWDHDLASFIEAHQICKQWNEWKGAYRNDFSDRVEQIMSEQKTQGTGGCT